MTLVLPRPEYTSTIPSSIIGEETSGYISWQRNTFDNKETTHHKSGNGNNATGVKIGSEAEQRLLHIAVPNPGYISTAPPPQPSPPRPTGCISGTLMNSAVTGRVLSSPIGLQSTCSFSSTNNITSSRPGTPCLLQPSSASVNMCGTTGPCLISPQCASASRRASNCSMKLSPSLQVKRKFVDYEDDYDPRPKRISPFLNTPKQRRDEKRKVLRISIQKLRKIDDPELFLRRSVLINNMTKRMQKELREEKRHGYGYYPSTFSSYGDYPVEQDCFYSSPPAHRKRLNSCSYGEHQLESESRLMLGPSQMPSSSPVPISSSSSASSSSSSTSCIVRSSSPEYSSVSLSSSPAANQHQYKMLTRIDYDDEVCVDNSSEPVDKLSDDLSDTIMRTVCGMSTATGDDQDHDGGQREDEEGDEQEHSQREDQDMESCASISDSSSEESSPPASPPSDTDMADCAADSDMTLSEMDKQILGEMDIVFNNLISVLSET